MEDGKSTNSIEDDTIHKELEACSSLSTLADFVTKFEDQLDAVTMDLVPVLTRFHYEFQPELGASTVDKIRGVCSNKELVLVCSEQLSLSPCLFCLPVLLPLFDLSRPYNAAWLAESLPRIVSEAWVCPHCPADQRAPVHQALVTCLQTVDLASSVARKFESVLLELVRQTQPRLLVSLFPVLVKFRHDIISILRGETGMKKDEKDEEEGEEDDRTDVHSVIVCTSIPLRTPQVYQPSYLFSVTLPWILSFLSLHPAHSDLVCPGLDTLHHFSELLPSLPGLPTSELEDTIRRTLEIGVSNPEEKVRFLAIRTVRTLLSKMKTSSLLGICEQFVSDPSTDISGFFIDQFRGVVGRDRAALDRPVSQRIVGAVLSEEPLDVLEGSNRVLATLSLLHFLPADRGFLSRTDRAVFLKEVELSSGGALPSVEGEMSVSVLGEEVSEPSPKERDASIDLARCRLDLIKFQIAALRDKFS